MRGSIQSWFSDWLVHFIRESWDFIRLVTLINSWRFNDSFTWVLSHLYRRSVLEQRIVQTLEFAHWSERLRNYRRIWDWKEWTIVVLTYRLVGRIFLRFLHFRSHLPLSLVWLPHPARLLDVLAFLSNAAQDASTCPLISSYWKFCAFYVPNARPWKHELLRLAEDAHDNHDHGDSAQWEA